MYIYICNQGLWFSGLGVKGFGGLRFIHWASGVGVSAGLGCEGLGVGFRAYGISGFSGRGWLRFRIQGVGFSVQGLGGKLRGDGVRRGSCTGLSTREGKEGSVKVGNFGEARLWTQGSNAQGQGFKVKGLGLRV